MPKRKTVPAPRLTPTDDEEWRANADDAKLSTVRYDMNLVDLFRQKAVAKLHNHAGAPLGEREAALVPVLNDDYFRSRFGAFLEHCGTELIVRLALEALLEAVHRAPPSRTGVRQIDDSRGFLSWELFERFVLSELGSVD